MKRRESERENGINLCFFAFIKFFPYAPMPFYALLLLFYVVLKYKSTVPQCPLSQLMRYFIRIEG